MVVYHDDLPFAVECEGQYYDFNFCKRNGMIYYHMSGAGPFKQRTLAPQYAYVSIESVKIWVRSDVTLVDENDQPADPVARGYQVLTVYPGSPFERDDAIEGQTIYCKTCDDRLPDDRDEPCEHIWWCDICNAQGGAVDDPECTHTEAHDG